jgi:hypothetical protein
MRKIIFFFFLLSFFVCNGVLAQVIGNNLAFLPEYQEQLPYFQELITGGQYQEPSRLIEGDPYYFSRQFEKGELTINGITYPDVPLLYDVYRDQVITFHPVFNQKILIKPEKIDGFSLANETRFRYFPGNEGDLRHGNGIYEVLGEGDYLALAKRYKTTKPTREMSQYDDLFVEKSDFFLWKAGEFYPIDKAKQAIEILALNPKEVKAQLRSNNLNFKQNPEEFLRFLVAKDAEL